MITRTKINGFQYIIESYNLNSMENQAQLKLQVIQKIQFETKPLALVI